MNAEVWRSWSVPAAIFLDADGTLLDTRDFLLSAHNHVRDLCGLPRFSHDDFHDMISSTTEEVYKKLYKEAWKERRDALFSYINLHQEKNLKPIEGVEETLISLLEQGIPLGIVSNKSPDSLNRALETLGWTSYFHAVVGAGNGVRGKPSPDPLFLAMERCGISRDRACHVWMVGDHGADIGCARAAGATGILVHYQWDMDQILATCEPHLVIPSLGSLQDMVSALSGKNSFPDLSL